MNNINRQIYAGTSGMVLPVPNKKSYPIEFQQSSRLHYYSSIFNSLEVNSSFYKIPMGTTVAKWAEEVPAAFKFTFKLWRDITHQKGLLFNPADVQRFIQTINCCGDHKGCLLVQFPPGLTAANATQLEQLLFVIRNADPNREWKTALEFRHSSWYEDSTYDLLDNYDTGLVIHDMPASAAPMRLIAHDFVYLRFHGPEGNYRGSYTDGFLYEYATYIDEWRREGKAVYVYFNNTMGDALKKPADIKAFCK